MNKDEALKVVKLMARPYNANVDSALVEIWFNSALSDVDYEMGLFVARRLVTTHTWLPKPAQFNEITRGFKQADRQARKAVGEETFVRDVDLAKKQLSEMRGKLRRG